MIGTERKNFPSLEAFFSWKESEEEATHTCFVQPKGETKSIIQGQGMYNFMQVSFLRK